MPCSLQHLHCRSIKTCKWARQCEHSADVIHGLAADLLGMCMYNRRSNCTFFQDTDLLNLHTLLWQYITTHCLCTPAPLFA